MKGLKKLVAVLFIVFLQLNVSGQTDADQEIRRLEQLEAKAVLTGDTLTLFKQIWAPEFIVNNPANMVVTKQQVTALIRTGKLDYESFERIIERISVIGNTAIVMGREEIKAEGGTDHTGKRVIRRYTNIWMKRDNAWKLVGRQATIVLVQ
jgi:hypothetical protein